VPPVRCVPTSTAKRALLEKGYSILAEDEWNWAFARGAKDYPILLPKAVPFVPMVIMQELARLLLIEPTQQEMEEATTVESAMDVDD
jgi:hypothetical protein